MLSDDLDVATARADLAASGRSRAPVARNGHLDDNLELTDVVREPVVFPDSVRVSEALRRFKAEHEQFGLVVDEHGAVDGIVTLEDLLEEIVGEIYDETDRDIMAVKTAADGSLVLPGTFPIHDLVDVGIELQDAPEGNCSTIAGPVLLVLGRIPERPGDVVQVSGRDIEVLAIAHHAVTSVRMRERS